MEYMGVASGCGCNEVYIESLSYYLSLLLLYMLLFAAASLIFVHFFTFFNCAHYLLSRRWR